MKIKVDTYNAESGPNLLYPPDMKLQILTQKWALREETCAKLCEEILKREESILKSYEAVEVAGLTDGITTRWLSYNVMTWDLPEVAECREVIKRAYLHYLKSAGIDRFENGIYCWGNILRKGENLKPHHHNFRERAVLSATISLTTSATTTNYIFPYNLVHEGTKEYVQGVQIPTVAGNLIMIPGWVTHYTSPVTGDEPRITLGMDIASVCPTGGPQIPFDTGKGEFKI